MSWISWALIAVDWISWALIAVDVAAASYLAFFAFLLLRDTWRDR